MRGHILFLRIFPFINTYPLRNIQNMSSTTKKKLFLLFYVNCEKNDLGHYNSILKNISNSYTIFLTVCCFSYIFHVRCFCEKSLQNILKHPREEGQFIFLERLIVLIYEFCEKNGRYEDFWMAKVVLMVWTFTVPYFKNDKKSFPGNSRILTILLH